MILNCIRWRGSSPEDPMNVEYPFITITATPGLLWPGVAVPFRVLFIGQIDLFKIDSYSIGP